MANTTNFGWETPDDTDLVKDGALAMRTLGNAIDTSLVDLKGGTTGQVLSKNTNTDMDFVWTTPNVGDITEVQAGTGISVASGTGPIPVVTNTVATAFDAKGDLVAGTGADTFAKLTVGANNTVLTADSSTATGLKWATPASGMTFISRTSFSNVATQDFDNVFSSTYESYLVVFNELWANTDAGQDLHFQLRTTTTQASGYVGNALSIDAASGQTNFNTAFSGTQFTIAGDTGASAASAAAGHMFIHKVGRSSRPTWNGQYVDFNQPRYTIFGGENQTTDTYTGFRLKLASTNLSGIVTVYGLAKS